MKAVITGLAILFAIAPSIFAREIRSEISVQGTGFFAHDTTDSGLARSDANSGGLLVGYRFRINRWLSAETNCRYTRNSQVFSGAFCGRSELGYANAVSSCSFS